MANAAVDLYCDSPDDANAALCAHVGAHRLLDRVKRLGLAVSGGADSVALLHLLLPLCGSHGIDVIVLHADHGLRPESADEASFVRALAEASHLRFLSVKLHLNARKPLKDSVEMAAREARHAFFADCCRRAELDAIATGHQADDLAENLLLRLTRGAGAAGLSALRPRSPAAPALVARAGRPYVFIRPLLNLSAKALREWLAARGLPWREDASNRDLTIPRNRLRHLALPQFESAWGGPIRAAVCRSADILREEDALLDALAERRLRLASRGDALDLRAVARVPVALRRRLLRRWLIGCGMAQSCGHDTIGRLMAFCEQSARKPMQLSHSCNAVVRNGLLTLAISSCEPPDPAVLPQKGTVRWDKLEIAVEPYQGIDAEAHGIGVLPAVCTLAADRAGDAPLTVRTWQTGDRIAPVGLAGTKKLHDLFIDAKIPKEERDAVPVFACGDDVVWVPGYRVSRRYAVPSPSAASVRITVRTRNPT